MLRFFIKSFKSKNYSIVYANSFYEALNLYLFVHPGEEPLNIYSEEKYIAKFGNGDLVSYKECKEVICISVLELRKAKVV